MAIAFHLPSDQDTLEQYRRIQQLMIDLLNLMSAMINSEAAVASPSPNSPVSASGSHFRFPTPPSSVPNSPSPFSPNASTSTSAFVLPDVITSAATALELRNACIGQRNTTNVVSPLTQSHPETESQMIDRVRRPSNSSISNKLRKRKRARISRKKRYIERANTESQPTTCCCERYKIPKIQTTENKCSCNMCKTNAILKEKPCDVPESQSEYFMDSAYYRRIAAAAATAAAANDHCKTQNSWMYIGEELRRMTDGFRQNKKDNGKLSEDISESKGINGVISQCGRTVFAAALLALGWKLLKQN